MVRGLGLLVGQGPAGMWDAGNLVSGGFAIL